MYTMKRVFIFGALYTVVSSAVWACYTFIPVPCGTPPEPCAFYCASNPVVCRYERELEGTAYLIMECGGPGYPSGVAVCTNASSTPVKCYDYYSCLSTSNVPCPDVPGQWQCQKGTDLKTHMVASATGSGTCP